MPDPDCPECKGLGGYPSCPECHNSDPVSASDTPRTDAYHHSFMDIPSEWVGKDFARQLERELNELSARLIERTAAYEKKDVEQCLLIGQWRYSAEMWKRQLNEAVEMLIDVRHALIAGTPGYAIAQITPRLAAILKKHES